MAQIKLQDLDSIVTIADDDVLYIEDISEATSNQAKKIEVSDLRGLTEVAAADITDATADGIALITSADANPFTDADESKLDGLAAGAEVNPDVVPQAEAEAGVATTERIWTAERVAQAIAALAAGGFSADEFWGGNLLYNSSIEFDADGAQPVNWLEEDANVTLTKEDAAGESIPELAENVFKVVNGAAGASKYVQQTVIIANEPLLDASVTVISAGVWVYTPDTGTITLELYDDGGTASLGTDTTTTEDSWVYLMVEAATLGTTSVSFRVSHSANSATLYFALPMLNVGTKARPWVHRDVSNQIFHAQHQETSGTNAGGLSSGAYRTRILNTVLTDTIGASLSSNQIVLPAGHYEIYAGLQMYSTDRTGNRLYNVTAGALLVQGEGIFVRSGAYQPVIGIVAGTFAVVNGTDAIELQTQPESTNANTGEGVQVGSAVSVPYEVFSDCIIRRLA